MLGGFRTLEGGVFEKGNIKKSCYIASDWYYNKDVLPTKRESMPLLANY